MRQLADPSTRISLDLGHEQRYYSAVEWARPGARGGSGEQEAGAMPRVARVVIADVAHH